MTNTGTFAADQLKSIVERYENIQEQVDDLKKDQSDILAEAKGNGFDVKTIREIIRLRKKDPAERTEAEMMLDLYKHALGMLADLPLGQAAMSREAGKPQ